MKCQVDHHVKCTGAVQHHTYLWKFIPLERDRYRFRSGTTTIGCELCEYHHNQLIEIYKDKPICVTGHRRSVALANLLLPLQHFHDDTLYNVLDLTEDGYL